MEGLVQMSIIIERRTSLGWWEPVAAAITWTIAEAIGRMLAKNGDNVRARSGSTIVEYTEIP